MALTDEQVATVKQLWPYVLLNLDAGETWTPTDLQTLWSQRAFNLDFPANLELIRAMQEQQQALAQQEN